jgi:predicted O-methyltransferase YrrM
VDAGYLEDWIAGLFEDRELLRMGHGQRKDDLNLGLGWLYYGMARVMRPQTVVVIGSWRGFVPMVFARALLDNGEGGSVAFIDPSLADDFWKDAPGVERYFRSHGLTNIRHYLTTTQEFVQSAEYRALKGVDIVFVDGYHTEEQAQFDYEAFRDLLVPHGIAFFHDSARLRKSHRYDRENPYVRTVRHYLDRLAADPRLQVIDFPWGEGVSLVRKVTAEPAADPSA